MKKFHLKSFMSELKRNDFVRACGIPLGFKASYPIVKKENDKVILIVPFNKINKTKTQNVSAVTPVVYTITFELHVVKSIPESIARVIDKETGYSGATPVGFETLKFSDKFSGIDFDKPLEAFPHKALIDVGKEEYKEKIEKIYEDYDCIINDYLGIEKAAGMERMEFKQLLNVLIGPVTKKMYGMIDSSFESEYLMG